MELQVMCNGQRWWWRLRSAGNHRILANSEQYSEKRKMIQTALKVAQRVLRYTIVASDLKAAHSGQVFQ